MVKTGMKPVDDTIENQKICRQYCGICPTFRGNKLGEVPPHELFCGRGTSSAQSKVKTMGCFCPACELFTRHGLIIGYFCATR